MSNPELKVFLGDVSAAAAAFETEATSLGNTSPTGGLAVPDGGGDTIDNAMTQAVQLLTSHHSQLVTALKDRARSLQSAYNVYKNTDVQISQVTSDLMKAAKAADGTVYSTAPVHGSAGASPSASPRHHPSASATPHHSASPRPHPSARPHHSASATPHPSAPASPAPTSDAYLSNEDNWVSSLLSGIGAPVTSANVATIKAWINHETKWTTAVGDDSPFLTHNPLNTTRDGYGSTGTLNSDGVKYYPTFQDGLEATIATLENGDYPVILGLLRSGQGFLNTPLAELSLWSDKGYSEV